MQLTIRPQCYLMESGDVAEDHAYLSRNIKKAQISSSLNQIIPFGFFCLCSFITEKKIEKNIEK